MLFYDGVSFMPYSTIMAPELDVTICKDIELSTRPQVPHVTKAQVTVSATDYCLL